MTEWLDFQYKRICYQAIKVVHMTVEKMLNNAQTYLEKHQSDG